MQVLDDTGRVLRINAPEWFDLPEFRNFLQRGTEPGRQQRVATFHRHGDEPTAWSDVFIPFEAYPIGADDEGNEVWTAEGSDICDSDELNGIWQEIVNAAQHRRLRHGVIWISNLAR